MSPREGLGLAYGHEVGRSRGGRNSARLTLWPALVCHCPLAWIQSLGFFWT